MEIKKYPVSGVFDYSCEISIYKFITVKLYRKNNKKLFGKWRRVSTKEYHGKDYYKYIYNLKKCAEDTVDDYEKWLYENMEHEKKIK